jgi:hypothetical protein
MFSFGEEFMVNLAITLAETIALAFTGYVPDWEFRDIYLRVFAINLGIQIIWDLIVYPYLVSPLRHLPRVHVSLWLRSRG